MVTHTIKVEPVMGVLTPFAIARSSHHFLCMARSYEAEGDAFLSRHYLFCVAIELAMKAAILGEDCTQANKDRMQKIGHNLVKLYREFEATFGNALLSDADLDSLEKINEHFRRKGLEYFTGPTLESALRGHSGLPDLESMLAVASKIDVFLESKGFYLDGKTSDTPQGPGIIHIV